jgi:glycosyltransferase involved in cell wall biosynthesis
MTSRRLRIAAFARVMPMHLTGGMPIVAEQILQGLGGLGHDVVLFTTERPGQTTETELMQSGGISVHCLLTGQPGRYSRRWFRALDRVVRHANAVRRFDVLVSMSAAARGLLPGWAAAGITAPSVVLTFGTHLDELRAGIHSMRGHVSLTGVVGGLARAGHTIYRAVRDVPFMRSPDALVVPCPGDRQKISQMFAYPPARIAVIPYGVPIALVDQLERAADPSSNLVTVVSRLERDKGIQIALGAMRRVIRAVPGARLRVVGDGTYRSELEELARSYDIGDRVEFTGSIPFERIVEGYVGTAVVLNPRLRPTAYDHVMVVGMSLGVPVITTDLGDTEFVAKAGEEALFVRAGDERALADAIQSCLTDRDRARRVGQAGLAAIRGRLTMEGTVDRYSEFLIDLVTRCEKTPR